MSLLDSLAEFHQGIWDHFATVRQEMEKDIFDLVEQVEVLTLGGILGSLAFEVTRSDFAYHWKLALYLLLLVIGLIALGVLHFLITHFRVLQEEETG